MQVQRLASPHGGVVELFSGIDSLYLSGHAASRPRALLNDLSTLRERAADDAEVNFGAIPFAFASGGFGRYRYRLDHPNGVLGVTDSSSLPTFRIQPRAAFIHGVGPASAVAWWSEVLQSVAGQVRLSASRLDVCADFHGLDFQADERDRFLCPSTARDEYTRGGFSGWVWGAPGAIQRARTYDKLADTKKKGSDWIFARWGDRYEAGRSVWRVEAQCKREVLVEYGIDTASDAVALASRVYRTVFSRFLTLRTPTADTNKSRWPLDPRWVFVAEPSFAFGAVGLDRVRAGRRSGELRKVLPLLVGTMATAAAALGVGLPDVCGPALLEAVKGYGQMTGKKFEDRCAERAARMDRASWQRPASGCSANTCASRRSRRCWVCLRKPSTHGSAQASCQPARSELPY